MNAPSFQSRFDGEYAQCPRCTKIGLGVDSWHPATVEFWPMYGRTLHFGQCLACTADQRGRMTARRLLGIAA
jgi:hypothetical protein